MNNYEEIKFVEISEDFSDTYTESNVWDESAYHKQFEKAEKKDNLLTPSMKNFRMLTGGLTLFIFAWCMIFLTNTGDTNYRENLASGKIEGVNAGDIISLDNIQLQPKNFVIESVNSYNEPELTIWDFQDTEDADYVQLLVNGVPQGEPFAIRHRTVNIAVPDNAIIQVVGIRDGSNNGITYGIYFNKTGETYLNTVPVNAANTYAFKTAQLNI